jgi:iron complex outermembrane receptor protein
MTATFTKRAALAATAMGVVLTTPALAQEAPDTTGGDIVVTARRVEERLQDVPISITVYNQEQLANRNIVNSTDLATYTPSLAVNSKFGPEKASFVIRGFSQDLNTQPTVAVYFADVVAPHLSSNITSGNGAGVGSMFDLQNVQVLKGPQGTLFGRNTTGGAILLVPQKPTDRLEGYVEGSIGNYDLRRVQAVLNVPLSDTFKVRAGVDRYVRDGYIHNRSGIGPKDFNDANYWSARLSIVADLTPDLENYMIATYSKSDTNGTLNHFAYCNRGTVKGTKSSGSTAFDRAAICAQVDSEAARGFGFYDGENSNPNPFVKQRQWQVINTTTWRASDTLTIKNIVSYGEARERYSFNLDSDFPPAPFAPVYFVTTYPGPYLPQGRQSSFTEEFQLQGRTADDRLQWQAGGYMERSNPIGSGQEQYTAVFSNCTNPYTFQCTPALLTVPLPSPPFPPGTTTTVSAGSVSIARNNYFYRNYGLYAQATYKFTDQLSVTAGIRNNWDWEHEDSTNIQVLLNPNGTLTYKCSRAATPANAGPGLLTSDVCGIGRAFTQKSNKPTWMVDIDFKPTPDILVYAKYARGYRAGGINEANLRAETWKPETVDDYELGLKTSWRGGGFRGTFNLAGFWNEFKNQQATVVIPQCVVASRATCTTPAPTGINGIQNVGRSRLRGIEADGSIEFGDLRLDFGYAYLDAKVTGGSAPFCDNASFECAQATFLTTGSVLPFAPKNRVTVTGTYTLPLDESLGRLSIGATFTHTDKQKTTTANDDAFSVGAIPFNGGISPATDLLNLNLNWNDVAGAPIDFALFASNVTNQKYWVAIGSALGTIGGESLVLGTPRMYGARLKFRFGS